MKRMKCRWLLLFVFLGAASTAGAQSFTRRNLAPILGFENGVPGQYPSGWGGSAGAFTDAQVFHGGKYSCRIDRTAASPGAFSTILQAIPQDFTGQTITWRGWVKTANVSDYAALWIRADGATPSLAFASSQNLGVNGTTDWTQYSVSIPVVAAATQLNFGFLVGGTGTGWVDDLEMLVDGVPVAQASAIPTVFTTDREFDNGSNIAVSSLSPVQIQNLATLAKVWGFLKYHHPAVTSGKHHWDYELFRIMPKVLDAADNTAANQAMSAWISGLEPVPACAACASLDPSGLYLAPDLNWIQDTALLGASLSQTLRDVYRNRASSPAQFFVELVSGTKNPQFDNEIAYPALHLPDSGYQLLGLFRAWNAIEYFYPNRDVMSDDPAASAGYWDAVLQQSIPGIATAPTSLAYQQQLLLFKAMIHDTHSGISNFESARPPVGSCQLPVQVRFVEGVPVVTGYLSKAGAISGLQAGDVIQELDGSAVTDLVAQWSPYYADSNEAARLRDISNSMTQGACGLASVSILRARQPMSLTSSRVATATLDLTSNGVADRPGDTFQMLPGNIAYLKLSSVAAAQSANYIRSAAGTNGLVVDIRNYPSDFVVFTLGGLLTPQPVNFVQFTSADVANPGAIQWISPPTGLTPAQPNYPGKVVVLVDELTQSQAEYTAMAFRAAGATIVGSSTAGADGNVSPVYLPGGFYFYFSGLGVFYPGHTPTQRVGIVPDVLVMPTIAGVRAGRDEVLDAAVALIEGRKPFKRPR